MSTRATNSENEEIATKADVDDRRKDEESEYTSEAKTEEIECAVCLQPCVHPVRLPCLHVFCFLCVKGVVSQSKRCAMCRQEIPSDYLDHPHLLNKLEEKDTECEGYQWFYEGRNGWWQYDERTSVELEAAYNSGNRVCEVLVAGFLYMVDFDGMVQQRRNDPSRRRRIKRDLASIPKKGIAGIKTALSEDPVEPRHTEVVSQSSDLQDLHLLHSEIYRNLNASRSGVIQSTDLTASSRTDNEDFTSNDSLNSTEDVTVDNVTNHLSDLTVASEDYSSYTEEYQLPNGDEL